MMVPLTASSLVFVVLDEKSFTLDALYATSQSSSHALSYHLNAFDSLYLSEVFFYILIQHTLVNRYTVYIMSEVYLYIISLKHFRMLLLSLPLLIIITLLMK